MFGPVRAVVVDDTPSHLFSISTGFSAAGIPCTPYWYDRSEVNPTKKLKPSPPEGGHEYLRVIFTDLNLDEGLSNLATVISPVVNVLSEIVSESGGPYAVIFWTKMGFSISEIREDLVSRLDAMNVPLPIAIDEISKGPFLEPPSEDLKGEQMLNDLFARTHAKTSDLKEEVMRVLAKYELLTMLSGWESRAIHAAGRSMNCLFDISKHISLNDDNSISALRKIFGLIAKESAGKTAAEESPAKAYDVAMQDILVDSFNQSVCTGDYPQLVESQLLSIISSNIEVDNKELAYARLNAMFHIDRNIENVKVIDRGAVVNLSNADENGVPVNIDIESCMRDYFWEVTKNNIDSNLPKISNNVKSLIDAEVHTIDAKSAPAISKAIDNIRIKRNKEIKATYNALKDGVDEFHNSLQWKLIEAGADCDHAQAKPRTLRYLLAVEVPNNYVADYVYGGIRSKLMNSALRLFGPYENDGEIFYLLISLKRFMAWQPPEELPEIQVDYRLRKVIVDSLLGNYATWSMRPGYTAFNP